LYILLTAAEVLICTPLSRRSISDLGFSLVLKNEKNCPKEVKGAVKKRVTKSIFFNAYNFEENENWQSIIVSQN
jgi:hypothetical protein